jgi:alpha-tubulin suppressor-like RCC1 family protein
VEQGGQGLGWGNNSYGQLGDGTSTSRLAAVQLSLSPSGKVSAGYFHSIALKLSGAVAATGSNVNGELGIADVLELGSPAPVSGISSVIEAAAGGTASIALRANGAVGRGRTLRRTNTRKEFSIRVLRRRAR